MSVVALAGGSRRHVPELVPLGRAAEKLSLHPGDLLSNDLGALAGFLFDLGTERYAVPPRELDAESMARWEADLTTVREQAGRTNKTLSAAREGDRTHTEVQGWLRDLGVALGFGVWIASNDRSRPYAGGLLGDACLPRLPKLLEDAPGAETIHLIDVLWIEPTGRVAAAFEVEHTTSIYSGIVRMLDLALGFPHPEASGLFLVAPDEREEQVRAQLHRPAFSRVRDLRVRFLPYSQLADHRQSMARFGSGLKAVEAVCHHLI